MKLKKSIENEIKKIHNILHRDPGNPLKPVQAKQINRKISPLNQPQKNLKKQGDLAITQSGKLTLIDIKLENNKNNPMRQSQFSKLASETMTLNCNTTLFGATNSPFQATNKGSK